MVVNVHEVWDAVVAPLAERIGVGVAGEGTAALAEGFRLAVAVGVDIRQTGAGQVVGIMQVFVVGDGVVVALGIIDAVTGAELNVVDVIRTGELFPHVGILADVV